MKKIIGIALLLTLSVPATASIITSNDISTPGILNGTVIIGASSQVQPSLWETSKSNPAVSFVTVGAVIIKTTDYGASWQRIYSVDTTLTLRSLSIHPTNENIVFITSDLGIQKSIDGGTTWSLSNKGLIASVTAAYSIGKVVFDPQLPSIMFATSNKIVRLGEYNLTVYRSIDSGTSWAATGVAWPMVYAYKNSKVSFDPANSNNIFFAGYSGLLRKDIIKRSADHGVTWSSLTVPAIPASYNAKPNTNSELRINAVNVDMNQKIYLSTNYGLFTSIDGGATWSEALNALQKSLTPTAYKVLFHMNKPKVMWLLCEYPAPNTQYVGGFPVKLLKTIDGGMTWFDMFEYQYNKQMIGTDIMVSPTNVNAVYGITYSGYPNAFSLSKIEDTGPEGYMAIDMDIPVTYNGNVTVDYWCQDETGCQDVRLSRDTYTWTQWQPVGATVLKKKKVDNNGWMLTLPYDNWAATPYQVTLSPVDGDHTLYIQLRDKDGFVTTISDTIGLNVPTKQASLLATESPRWDKWFVLDATSAVPPIGGLPANNNTSNNNTATNDPVPSAETSSSCVAGTDGTMAWLLMAGLLTLFGKRKRA